MMKNRKGFTLVELILAISFLVLIIILSMSMLTFGIQAQKRGDREFEVQAGVRLSSETAVQTVRYADVIYPIPEEAFNVTKIQDSMGGGIYDTSSLAKKWSYFGVVTVTLPGGAIASEVTIFKWNKEADDWDVKVVMEARADVIYDLLFEKDIETIDTDNLLGFKITGRRVADGEEEYYITVDSQVEAANVLQVMTRGLGTDMTAIAFRSPDDDDLDDVMINVVLVYDISGAMNESISDSIFDTKYTILMPSLRSFLELATDKAPQMNVLLVPFADTANANVNSQNEDLDPFDRDFTFRNIIDGRDAINADIDEYRSYPDGFSNLGDAMRRAYYKLKEYNEHPDNEGKSFKNYVLVFANGSPNSYVSQLYYPPSGEYNTHQFSLIGETGTFLNIARFDYGDFYAGYTSENNGDIVPIADVSYQKDNYLLTLPYNPPVGALVQPNGVRGYKIAGSMTLNPGNVARAVTLKSGLHLTDARNLLGQKVGGVANPIGYKAGEGAIIPIAPYTDYQERIEGFPYDYIAEFTSGLTAETDRNAQVYYIAIPGITGSVGINKTADALGIDPSDDSYFFNLDLEDAANYNEALELMKAAFVKIGNTMVEDIWKVTGPELKWQLPE